MSKLYEGLKKSFDEMIAHKKGKITLRSESIEIPEPPKHYIFLPILPSLSSKEKQDQQD